MSFRTDERWSCSSPTVFQNEYVDLSSVLNRFQDFRPEVRSASHLLLVTGTKACLGKENANPIAQAAAGKGRACLGLHFPGCAQQSFLSFSCCQQKGCCSWCCRFVASPCFLNARVEACVFAY